MEKESLVERGLSLEDLMALTWEDEADNWTEKSSLHVVSRLELTEILEKQDVILNF